MKSSHLHVSLWRVLQQLSLFQFYFLPHCVEVCRRPSLLDPSNKPLYLPWANLCLWNCHFVNNSTKRTRWQAPLYFSFDLANLEFPKALSAQGQSPAGKFPPMAYFGGSRSTKKNIVWSELWNVPTSFFLIMCSYNIFYRLLDDFGLYFAHRIVWFASKQCC